MDNKDSDKEEVCALDSRVLDLLRQILVVEEVNEPLDDKVIEEYGL